MLKFFGMRIEKQSLIISEIYFKNNVLCVLLLYLNGYVN